MAIRVYWYVIMWGILCSQQPIVCSSTLRQSSAWTTNKQLAFLAAIGGLAATGIAWKKHYLAPLILRYTPETILRRTPLWLVFPGLKIKYGSGEKIPIVYRDEYNFSQGGVLNKMLSYVHPFDTQKYRTIARVIQKAPNIRDWTFYKPPMATNEDLLLVHSQRYLDSLKSSSTISEIIDMGRLLSWVPNSFFQHNLLIPMKYAVGGTILGAQLALEYGWAINLAGGYHHAKADKGEGGCVYADIPIAIKKLWKKNEKLKVMIIDLDAHHSNGIESILGNDKRVYIFDVFNKNVAPVELELVRTWSNVYAVPLEGGQLSSKVWGIDMPDILVERCVNRSIKTDEYIQRLKHTLPIAFELCTIKFGQHPDLVIYNAGTDIHKDDAWGCMNIDTQGIYARDQYVFKFVMEKNIPIFMLPAGGYFKDSGKVIGSSIVHLINTVINPLIQKRTKQQQAQ